MALTSRGLLLLGTILLSHACYSAYEHSLLHTSYPTSSSSSNVTLRASQSRKSFTTLPPDISLETIVSVILICIALVLGAEGLKPISWRIWAGEMEREAKEKGAGESGGIFGGLEDGRRLGFVDIRKQRKEFADWVREKGKEES